jgi:signal transduction histidine kinase
MSELLNLIGLTTGVALYAMLLVMVVRSGRVVSRFDPLLVTTAVLGLVWNLSALPAYELPKLGMAGPFTWLNTLGFSALGFLPAVVVQSVLRGNRQPAWRSWNQALAVAAYAVSVIAALLHVRAAVIGESLPSPLGMRLLTYTFIALVVPLFVVTHDQPGARRALWAAALSIFAVSALHLSQFHRGDASWPVELLGHHASLPLAFAILYQDFPFALADLFLKRALTLLAVVTLAFVAVVSLNGAAASSVARARDVAILVTLWVTTALLYPSLRRVTGWFVDAVVLDRPDYDTLQKAIGQRIRELEDIDAVLDEACSHLAPALSARVVSWHEIADSGSADRKWGSLAASVDVPVAEPPRFAIAVSELTAGRRLLSDDRGALDAIAATLGRRIDAIRLARERYERQLREQEIGKLATEAELRALRAQINPHFLFNALTTIGYLIQTAPPRALQTLLRLTTLLRAVLRSEGDLITLGRELEVVEAYLDIERARFEHRLVVTIEVPFTLRSLRVPPLVLQPLVENAVKHGIAPLRQGGSIQLRAAVENSRVGVQSLVLSVRDSGAGVSDTALEHGRATGVGLRNVERRLLGHYGDAASLTIRSVPGEGTVVMLRLPVQRNDIADSHEATGQRMVM